MTMTGMMLWAMDESESAANEYGEQGHVMGRHRFDVRASASITLEC